MFIKFADGSKLSQKHMWKKGIELKNYLIYNMNW